MDVGIFKIEGRRSIPVLLMLIVIPEAVGVLSALFTRGSFEKYNALQQPPFSPPSWIFAPVWSALFFLMGYASYRIWMRGIRRREGIYAFVLYGLQLILNFWWTLIFFRFAMRETAFYELLVLLVFVVYTTIRFFKLDKPAGVLMMPYVLWTMFAAVLNYSIWMLNA